jgi:hypothetical protein
MKFRNQFFAEGDGALCAIVESAGLWFDIAARKSTVPPTALRDAFFALPRTDPFERW